MQDHDKHTLRALRTGALLTFAVTGTLYALSYRSVGWGFLIGAALSLFSLLSLTVIVPFLFRPGAPQGVKVLLALTLFMKLPLFVLGLLLLTHLSTAGLLAAVLGISLAPAVITLQALGGTVAVPTVEVRQQAPHPQHSVRSAHPGAAELATERG